MKKNYLDLFQNIKEKKLTELSVNKQNSDTTEVLHLEILKELLYDLYHNQEDTNELVLLIEKLIANDAKTIEILFPHYINDSEEINFSWLFTDGNVSTIIQSTLETIHFRALETKEFEVLSKINRILFDHSSALSGKYLERTINKNSIDRLLRIDVFYIWQDLNAKKLQQKEFVRLKSSIFREVFADDYFIPAQINFYKESSPFDALNIFIYRASECYILRDEADFFLSLVEILESVLYNCIARNQYKLHYVLDNISDIWSKKLLNDLTKDSSFKLAIERRNQWTTNNAECGIADEDVPANPRKFSEKLVDILHQVKATSITNVNFSYI